MLNFMPIGYRFAQSVEFRSKFVYCWLCEILNVIKNTKRFLNLILNTQVFRDALNLIQLYLINPNKKLRYSSNSILGM